MLCYTTIILLSSYLSSQAYLTDFLTQFAQQPCYSMFSSHLNEVERRVLQSIGIWPVTTWHQLLVHVSVFTTRSSFSKRWTFEWPWKAFWTALMIHNPREDYFTCLPVLLREEMDIDFLREEQGGEGTPGGTVLDMKWILSVIKTLLCFGRFVWCHDEGWMIRFLQRNW